jgi:hypothetical protein
MRSAIGAERSTTIAIPASGVTAKPNHAAVLRKALVFERNFRPKTLVNVHGAAIVASADSWRQPHLPPLNPSVELPRWICQLFGSAEN